MEFSGRVQKRASEVATAICGRRPSQSNGWNAKIYDAAWQAAARVGADFDCFCAPEHPTSEADVALARVASERVLLARITKVPAERRAGLSARVAQIRAGLGDDLPEVQAVVETLRMIRDEEVAAP